MTTNHFINQLGVATDFTSRQSRFDSLSILSRQSVLAILVVCLTMLGVGQMWGTTVSWTASSGALGSNTVTTSVNATGTINTGTFTWNYTRSYASRETNKSDYVAWQSTNGYIQLGSGNFRENVSFTTSAFSGKVIESVSVNCASASGNHTLTIDVNGTKYRNGVSTPTWSSNNGSTITGPASGTGSSSGDITITLSAGTGAVYIKSISVTYSNACSGTKLGTPTVSAVPSSGQVALSWPAVANASSYSVTCLNTSSGSSAGSVGSVTGTSTKTCTVSSLSNGTSYTFSVQAIGDQDDYCNGDATEVVRIAGSSYTVTWMVNGESYETTYVYSGGSKNLVFPTAPSSCDAKKIFVGWTATNIGSSETDTPPSFVTSGTTINANATYYAVFAKRGRFNRITGPTSLSAGQLIVITGNKYSSVITNGIGYTTPPTEQSDTLTNASTTEAMMWLLTGNSSSGWAISKVSNGYLLGYASNPSSNNSTAATLASNNTKSTWKIGQNSYTSNVLYISNWSTNNCALEPPSASANWVVYNTSSYSSNQYTALKVYASTLTKFVTQCCTALASINGSFF